MTRDTLNYILIVGAGLLKVQEVDRDDTTPLNTIQEIVLDQTTEMLGNPSSGEILLKPFPGRPFMVRVGQVVGVQDLLGRSIPNTDTYGGIHGVLERTRAASRIPVGLPNQALNDPSAFVADQANEPNLPLPVFGFSVLSVDLDTLAGDLTIQGIEVPASKEQATFLLRNTSSTHSILLENESEGQADETKRVKVAAGTIAPGASVYLSYDFDAQMWRSTGGSASTEAPAPPAPTYELLDQWDHLLGLDIFANDAAREVAWSKRFASNVVSGGAVYTLPNFTIPAGVTYQDGEQFVDPETGLEHTIVKAADRTIKNSERWIINNEGLFFYAIGSGSATRNLEFYKHGQRYSVLGQTGSNPHRMSITVNAPDSTQADNRANNAWFLTDSILAWVSDDNEISYRDIDTQGSSVQTFSFTFPANDPAYAIDLNQSDAASVRRAYTGPLHDTYREAYNAVNTTNPIDTDKVYRIFHVNSDKTAYIVLVYTISTGQWSFLTGPGGSATTSETATPTVHTLSGLLGGTTIDHLCLTVSGKGIYSNTDGDGFNFHYITGEKVVRLYDASNHKGYGTINANTGAEIISEKATPAASQNAAYGNASEGDMLFIEFIPETLAVVGYPILKMPPGEPATEYGGDQGANAGSRIHALAGHRDVAPQTDRTFDHSVMVLDYGYGNMASPDLYKWGSWRVANLNVLTGGGDGKDPGALPGIMYEHPNHPGKYVTEVYWFDDNIPHDGGTGDAIMHTIIPIEFNLANLKTAMSNAGYERQQ